MEKVTKEEVKHVAGLARIKLSAQEVSDYQEHLAKILNHARELEKVDVKDVQPLTNTLRDYQEFYIGEAGKREDKIKKSLDVEKVLKNAPDEKYNQFKVEAYFEEN